MQHLEAVFEQGVLRPLQPLALAERQHVQLTVTELHDTSHSTGSSDSARIPEQEWIRDHGADYRGQWVALQGSELISHGPRGRDVHDEARAKGFSRASRPSAG